jgi:hypothetical protein
LRAGRRRDQRACAPESESPSPLPELPAQNVDKSSIRNRWLNLRGTASVRWRTCDDGHCCFRFGHSMHRHSPEMNAVAKKGLYRTNRTSFVTDKTVLHPDTNHSTYQQSVQLKCRACCPATGSTKGFDVSNTGMHKNPMGMFMQ